MQVAEKSDSGLVPAEKTNGKAAEADEKQEEKIAVADARQTVQEDWREHGNVLPRH